MHSKNVLTDYRVISTLFSLWVVSKTSKTTFNTDHDQPLTVLGKIRGYKTVFFLFLSGWLGTVYIVRVQVFALF